MVSEVLPYLGMKLASIEITIGDHPLPAPIPAHRPAANKEAMFSVLGTMEPGGSTVDVNRSKRAVLGYIQRFRVQVLGTSQFVVRSIDSGRTRIWRVK